MEQLEILTSVYEIQTSIENHMNKKSNFTKSNKCNQCDYASSDAGNLRRHLKTHSGEKSNKCNQCDFASSHAGDLRRHLTKHSGEKYKKCNQCDYVSCYANDLRRHLQRHSGEKSNKCNQCGFASSYSNFKDTFENAQWGKVKQMQPMWLCILLCNSFEITHANVL